MHPIGQILNFDSCPEFQGRGTEHFHSPVHVIGAPKIDEVDDKNVTCSIQIKSMKNPNSPSL